MEVRSQKSEVRSQKSEVRMSDTSFPCVKNQNPIGVLTKGSQKAAVGSATLGAGAPSGYLLQRIRFDRWSLVAADTAASTTPKCFCHLVSFVRFVVTSCSELELGF